MLLLLGCAPPSLTETTAREVASQHVYGELGSAEQRGGAWQVLVQTPLLRSYRVVLDEHTGDLVRVADLNVHARGRVYAESPIQGDPIDVELLTDEDVLENGVVTAYTIVFDEDAALDAEHLALPDEDGDFLYDPDEPSVEDPFAEVQAFHHVSSLEEHFFERHGVVFPDGIDVFTNYREHPDLFYANAYMSIGLREETVLVFGQGPEQDYSYDADVVAHEFAHGLIFAASALEPGAGADDEYGRNVHRRAINEGLADYIAADWFSDSLVGDYFGSSSSNEFGGRDVDNDAICPDDFSGEAHQDGLIVAGALWEVRAFVGTDEMGYEMDDLVHGMLGRLPSSASFSDVATALLDEAADTAPEHVEDIEAVMTARGLIVCSRLLELPDGEVQTLPIVLFADVPEIEPEICELSRDDGLRRALEYQLVYTFPDGREAVDLQVDVDFQRFEDDWVDGEQDWTLYVRADERVTLSYESAGEGPATPVGDAYDQVFSTGTASFSLDALEQGRSYYFALTQANCALSDLHITATASFPTHPPQDPEGCGCSSWTPPGSALGLFALCGLLAARRRR